jgi:hypothetical protein
MRTSLRERQHGGRTAARAAVFPEPEFAGEGGESGGGDGLGVVPELAIEIRIAMASHPR